MVTDAQRAEISNGFGAQRAPLSVEDITPDLLNAVVAPWTPQAAIDSFELSQARLFGDPMVSSGARVTVEPRYRQGAPEDLPRRLLLKFGVTEIDVSLLYRNEVRIYNLIRPWELLESPRSLGASYDPEARQFAILMEDLTLDGGVFPNVTHDISVEHVQRLLAQLARLHGRFWQSPRFAGDLAWLETHVEGELAEKMNDSTPKWIAHQVETIRFKQEFVQKLGTTPAELLKGLQAVQRHQATLPQTLLHGDAHLGNTFLRKDGRAGFLDWQLAARGCFAHDVHYVIATGLSVGARRKHERELLTFYLEALRAAGVQEPPSFDAAFREYRRAMIWGLYIGWLSTALTGYGWEIVLLNTFRMMAAYEDLETAKLVKELL